MSSLGRRELLNAADVAVTSLPGIAATEAMPGPPSFIGLRKGLQIACMLFVLCLPAPSLAGSERCPEATIDVTAESPDERRLACSAASAATQLLSRCRISLIRPLRLQIMNEVRHPFGGLIFGMFDAKRESVLVT